MERKSKGSRGLEAYCKGGQGPPWAVAPSKKKKDGTKASKWLGILKVITRGSHQGATSNVLNASYLGFTTYKSSLSSISIT